MARLPFTGPASPIQDRGKLGVYKQDFNAHIDGTAFRQHADTIDMQPTLPKFVGATVQEVLEEMDAFLSSGVVYFTIGNGSTSFGTVNVGDVATPTIEDCFAAGLANINISHNGGVIFLKSGIYNFTSTITLPAGVSVFGEIGGAIINATSSSPIFLIEECPNIGIGGSSTIYSDGYRVNKFYNLTFFDNKNSNAPALSNSQFIRVNRGSNVEIDRCVFFGKANTTDNAATKYAVFYDSSSLSTNASLLSIKNSYFCGVQKAVDFYANIAYKNKFQFKNNKVWFSGLISGTTNRDLSAVSFVACDCNFSNNDFLFGLNSTLQYGTCCLACFSAGSSLKNMIVFGNTLNTIQGTITNLLSTNNNLIREDSSGLRYIRSVISGNSTGGSSDSHSWYIVVGDGDKSIGDINGTYAIDSFISNFKNDQNVLTHGQITIFVKPGNYYINNANFRRTAGIDYKLIGLPENGNFPIINMQYDTPNPSGEDSVMFGSHIENLYFYSESYYYRVTLNDSFGAPDTRDAYFTKCVAKNCTFLNCGIGQKGGFAGSLDESFLRNFEISYCQFTTSSSLVNVSIKGIPAIYLYNRNGKICIEKCQTISKGKFYGKFLRIDDNSDTYNNCELYVDKCILYSQDTEISGEVSDGFVINIECVLRHISITDNIVDYSQVSDDVYFYINILGKVGSSLVIKNNRFIGNNFGFGGDASKCIYSKYFTDVFVSENIFEGVGVGICHVVSDTDDANNVHITNNELKGQSHDYGLCLVYQNDVSSVPIGIINITGNVIVSGNDPYFPAAPFSENSLGHIMSYVKGVSVNVNNNYIKCYSVYGSSTSFTESDIQVIGASNIRIDGNAIDVIDSSTVRNFFSIYASSSVFGATLESAGASASSVITNNRLSRATGTGTTGYTFIFSRDIGNNIITGNVMVDEASTDPGWCIQCHTQSTSGCQGIITDNILSEALSNGGILYRNNDITTEINKMYVSRNKNQKIYKHINCTEFKQYGSNTDITPYSSCACVFKSTQLILNNTISNMNGYQQHIMYDGVPGAGTILTWDALPEGLYYSNFPSGYTPALAIPEEFGGLGDIKHQIIVPINLPEFIKLTDIEYPVYMINNNASLTLTVSISSSLILGNYVTYQELIEYIPDDQVYWARKDIELAPYEQINTVMSNTITDLYITPTRNSSTPTAQQNCYLLIAIRMGALTGATTEKFFAIPQIKLTLVY